MVLAEDLRQAVLLAALQGKLTKQLDTDGNVDEMLVKMQEEKEKLVADKKIKKEKPLPEIQDEEIPFDIPDNWRWVRLGDVVKTISAGGDKPKNFSKEKTKLFSIPVIANGETNDGILGYTDEATIKEKSLTVSGRGTIGFSLIRTEPYVPIVRLLVITSLQQTNLYYIQCVLKSLVEMGIGTAVKQLTVPMIQPKVIPFPPIEEQQRIVDKINEIMPKIDEYEKIENDLERLKKEFSINMKEALLQAAMQGKLTEQLESDSSVDEFISREKINILIEDNYPYFIPNNWRFVQLENLTSIPIKRGKSPKYVSKSGVLVFAQKCNQKNGSIAIHDAKYLDETIKHKYEQDNYLQGNDIVINSTGGGTLGRIGYILEELIQNSLPIVPDSHVTTIRTKNDVLPRYIYFFLKFNQPYLEKMGVGSTNQTELRPDTIKELLVPLPPIEEQQRIVERLEVLLTLCEDLKE